MRNKNQQLNPLIKGFLLKVIDWMEQMEWWIQSLENPKKRKKFKKRVMMMGGGLIFLSCFWNWIKPTEPIIIQHRPDSEFFQQIVYQMKPYLKVSNSHREQSVWTGKQLLLTEEPTNYLDLRKD